ncbi:MAG: histidine kinase N-terminal 7TM domain-containing protein [Haloarculaceae archaeon]
MVQTTPYTLPLVLVVAIGVVGAALTWRQCESRAEAWFVAVELSVAGWALTQLVVLSVSDPETSLQLAGTLFPLMIYLPVTVFGFTLHYTGRGAWLTRPRLAGLLALPLVPVALVHLLGVRGSAVTNVHVVRASGYQYVAYNWGWIGHTSALVSYGFVISNAVMLYRKFRRSRNVYRTISAVLFVTVVVMGLASAATFAGLSPFPHMLLLPFSFLLFGGVAILSLSSKRFLQALPVDRALAVITPRGDRVLPLARDFVLEEIDNGVIVLDEHWGIVDINSTAKRMLGADRAVGRHVTDAIDFSTIVDRSEIVDELAGREGEAIGDVREQVWVRTDDGDERCYDVTLSPLESRGDVVGHVVLLHDVTEQKRREEALREREEELEQQKRSLQHQKAQLEHQNERLDRFASIVSHDLRNPLNVADGYAEMLAAAVDGETGTVSREQIDSIRSAHDRMEAIIDDALTLARQGKAITETEPVDLAAVATEAWEHVDTADATLTVDADLVVEADRDRLLNLFENLYRNAVEHAGETVTVTVGSWDDGDGEVGFFVADDGVGIPDDQKEAVLDHGFTTSEAGTGLGLSIVADVARAHGWSVSITDSGSGGARVEFDDIATQRRPQRA